MDLATASLLVTVIGLVASLAVSTIVFVKSSKVEARVGEVKVEAKTEIMTVEMKLRIDLAKCEFECSAYRTRVEVSEAKIAVLEKLIEKLADD